ncbi:MAG TPA: ankyrin repeat domain-containing protein [Syntrophales bacterium]|nr:ankyrin repeat domain-containing protein [Syntrophales bacterium]
MKKWSVAGSSLRMGNARSAGILMAAACLLLIILAGPAAAGLNEDLLATVNAGWNKDLDKIRALIDQGADVNARNKFGDTPLTIAARMGSNETVKLLLGKGADVHLRSTNTTNVVNSVNSWTPLMFAAMRRHNDQPEPIRQNIDMINALLAKGADLDARTNDGKTALFLCAREGNTVMAKYLMDKGADVNVKLSTTDGYDGYTPLLYAAIYDRGRNPVMMALIEKGADVNVQGRFRGYTAVIYTAWKGNIEILKVLLERGADVNAKTKDGETALMYAAASGKGYPDVVKLLLAKGADVNAAAQGDNGKTALTAAANNGNTEIVKMLLDKGANVNAMTKESPGGKTALIYAAGNGHVETVKALLERGANPNAKTTRGGDTALKLAKEKGYTAIIDLLEQAGAK